MIQPHAFVVRPAVSEIAPKGPERPVRLDGPQSIGPAHAQEPLESISDLRLQKRVRLLVMANVDVCVGGNDIEVAGQHDRHVRGHERGSVSDKPIEPA